MRRALISWGAVILGLVLMAVSYFFLAAPWGASGVRNSNPRLQFAPAIFVVGVMLVFGSALLYELLPGRRRE
jgi:hypothetical protein